MGYFERFVSRRYLFARERKALVSIITLISIAGVTVGVAALIIVIGIIDGIDRDIFSKIVEIYPHVKIQDAGSKGIAAPEKILQMLRERPEVRLAEPVVSNQVLFTGGTSESSKSTPGTLVGVEKLGKGFLYDLSDQFGKPIEMGPKETIISVGLAVQRGLKSGDMVNVMTGSIVKAGGSYRIPERQLRVIGVFRTGLVEFDENGAFVSTETARDLFRLTDAADFISVKVKKPFEAREIKAKLASQLGADYQLVTWEDENGELFQALRLEKLGLLVILLLVVIVASFNIIGTLILMVIQKTREVGILKAIGASERMIHRTFLTSGVSIGLIGTACGLAIGLFGCFLVRDVIKLDLPPQVFAFERLPVNVKPLTVTLIVASSLTVSVLAALFPAAQAARLDPVQALRHD